MTLGFKITPANVHDSIMLPPLIESIEENLPNQKIEKFAGDKAYGSSPNRGLLEGKKITDEIIPKEEPKTKLEKIKRKKLNAYRAMIETIYGLTTTKLGLEEPRLRGIEAINFNTALVFLALLSVNIVAFKIGREDKINCPTFFFR